MELATSISYKAEGIHLHSALTTFGMVSDDQSAESAHADLVSDEEPYCPNR